MLPEQQAASYRAFLLRLWRVEGGWRACLIDPHTGQQQAFLRLQALFEFVTSLTQDPPGPPAPAASEPLAAMPDE